MPKLVLNEETEGVLTDTVIYFYDQHLTGYLNSDLMLSSISPFKSLLIRQDSNTRSNFFDDLFNVFTTEHKKTLCDTFGSLFSLQFYLRLCTLLSCFNM